MKLKNKIYCLSGLGVDHRAFQRIHIENYELVHVVWIQPLINESLTQYAKRLYDSINPEDDYSLMGVSFGGMMAIEFSKMKKPKNLILISTIYSSNQLSKLFKLGTRLRLYKVLPSFIIKRGNWITNYFFGIIKEEDKKLLDEILQNTDSKFFKWAINAIANWQNKEKPDGIFIHGTNDRILPMHDSVNFKINNGGHFMIVSHADEISSFLKNYLLIKL